MARNTLQDILLGITSAVPQDRQMSSPEGSFGQGLARGFTSVAAVQDAMKKRQEEEDKKKELDDFINVLKTTPPEQRPELTRNFFLKRSPEKALEMDFQRDTELQKEMMKPGKGKTVRIKVSQINPNIPKELDREVDIPEEKYLELFKPEKPKETDTFDTERKLREELSGRSKQFSDIDQSYRRVVDSARTPSAAGDLALIFNYMKILDPGSVVREGEFATAQNSGGVPDIIRARYNKVVQGERLSDPIRKDFLDRATKLYSGQRQLQDVRESEFKRLAELYKVNPEAVIVKFGIDVFQTEEEANASSVEKGKPIVIGGRLAVKE